MDVEVVDGLAGGLGDRAEVDLARRTERERLVRQVRSRDGLQELARARTLHVDLRVGARHVGLPHG